VGSATLNGCDLYHVEAGDGVPILLIHPAGSTASTWGAAADELGRVGRVKSAPIPSAADLATVHVPVVCSYGARSPDSMFRLVRSLASAVRSARTRRIEGAGHAAPFDAPANFVELVADAIA
jgi:pimeloyl-ACP methyl ester carboxylesterase